VLSTPSVGPSVPYLLFSGNTKTVKKNFSFSGNIALNKSK